MNAGVSQMPKLLVLAPIIEEDKLAQRKLNMRKAKLLHFSDQILHPRGLQRPTANGNRMSMNLHVVP